MARFPRAVLAAGAGLLVVTCAAIPSMQVTGRLESLAGHDDPAFVGQRLLASRFGLEGAPLVLLVEGDELAPVEAATTVRVRDGQTLVSDGPYAEVKESLGGYFLFECATLDEALDWAARIPAAAHGAVEVRPVNVEQEA
mgnify:CR=1 FL=1